MPQEKPEALLIELLIQKLCHRDELSEAEKNALRGLAVQAKDFARGEELVAFGDTPNVSQLLVSGFVCRTRFMAGGDRQILAVHVPGDFVDLQSFLLKRMDHSVVALAPTKVAIFPHDGLTRITEEFPHLARMLWLSTLIDAAIHREWLLSLGRQSALQRTAHFLCELCARLEVVDKPRDGRFDLPLTQTDLSDVLGLSPRPCEPHGAGPARPQAHRMGTPHRGDPRLGRPVRTRRVRPDLPASRPPAAVAAGGRPGVRPWRSARLRRAPGISA